ncbi:lipopolysaccharide biosynthesis protein [Aromatoleum diolicum]|uniref:Oligosaccharide flippase family protein n=1 Tax=Aromatoleum diolicum TaxID=75796 RepID=A0ABX1QCE1_9RHOO|nr:lipopolysaccharide biosynthesis protein [Aromatoleum diolicum]NMG76014.1 oligosaccharide flippase family protein [Aromatoleum diolicum]
MPLGDKIRRGAMWLFVGNTGSQVLTFAFGIVLARLLTPEDFGMLVTIQVFTGLAGFVAGGGMGQALIRASTTSKQDYDIVFTLQLAIGCAIYAGFYAAAPWIAAWYDTPLYANLLRVAALSFVIRPFVNLPGSILHRDMRFKALTVVRVATLIISSTISIGMAYRGQGVWSLIVGGMAGSICSMALLVRLSEWRPGFSLDIARGRNIARYGALVSINDVVTYLRNQATNFILGRTLGVTQVGLFNKADNLARMPHGVVTRAVYQVLFRALAKEQDNPDMSRYLFFRSLSLVAVYVTPLYVGIYWTAVPLIALLYGAKWADAAAPLAILALAGPFMTIANLSGAVLAARNELGHELKVQFIVLALTIVATLSSLPYGLSGIAVALVLVSIYNALHMYALAARSLHARWKQLATSMLPAIALNAILASVLYLLDRYIPAALRDSDFRYLGMMAATGGLTYTLCFLYSPIAALGAEQRRWKQRLRLESRTAP